jgi:hypothetical protein
VKEKKMSGQIGRSEREKIIKGKEKIVESLHIYSLICLSCSFVHRRTMGIREKNENENCRRVRETNKRGRRRQE